jgi:hypothetical protein
MTDDRIAECVPCTTLRKRYLRLKNMDTKARLTECETLISDVSPLVHEFVKAAGELGGYDRREDRFYPEGQRKTTPHVKKGATEMFGSLRRQPVTVPDIPSYTFRITDREINPLRTIGVRALDGTSVSRKGRAGGGLDYIGLLEGSAAIPILGEIKAGVDNDTYYAFVQLLTYLTELSTPAQLARANKYLFGERLRLNEPIRFDLHVLLADYNAKGKEKQAILQGTRLLAKAFRTKMEGIMGARHSLGLVLCLRTSMSTFAGSLELVWPA